jgi:2,4-didehydro-3-deoxy-L-rhamnonate hydrolase
MRFANLAGRFAVHTEAGALDVERVSAGRFGPSPDAVFERWDEFTAWAATAELAGGDTYDQHDLGSPSPTPRQVFAIGLNYREHAGESGYAAPVGEPPVFTKFPSCIVGPHADVRLPSDGTTDWEVELVVVIGRTARNVSREDAARYVAGYTIGQDLSERKLQSAAVPPQFSLGKSLPGFGPVGPVLVTLEEFADPDDLALCCSVNGETLQQGRTRDMIFSVPELIAKLSATLPLRPGDLIFTGTPAGVGIGRKPPRFLRPGDELVSRIDGIGEMRNRLLPSEGVS